MDQDKIISIVEQATGLRATNSHAPEGADLDVWEALAKTKLKIVKEELKLPKPLSNRDNLRIILEHDPIYQDLNYQVMSDKICLGDTMIEPHTLESIALDLEVRYKYYCSDDRLRMALIRVARQNEQNPLKDYLMGLQWDQKPRLVNLFGDYFRASTVGFDDLISEIGIRWMISCVARALQPGCKMDTCLVLVGFKGIYKSTALETLCGPEWFSDSDLPIDHKDGKELIHQSGTWIWELSEMHSLHGKSADNAKAFLSSRVDRYRPSYARMPVEKPRRVVFTASTNEWQFLSDGPERRFWPIVCGKDNQPIKIQKLKQDRDQLWAEAVNLYESDPRWWLLDEHSKQLVDYQEIFLIDDPWAIGIQEYFSRPDLELSKNHSTTSALMEALLLPASQQHSGNARRLAKIMRDMNYQQKKSGGLRRWVKRQL
jgi:putative DNA primase/helicase